MFMFFVCFLKYRNHSILSFFLRERKTPRPLDQGKKTLGRTVVKLREPLLSHLREQPGLASFQMAAYKWSPLQS